jgi:hypothetical protein
MKNLFNDISQDEKNRILEMHSAKKNVISEQYTMPIPNNGNPLLRGTRPTQTPRPRPNRPSQNQTVAPPKPIKELKVGTIINVYGDSTLKSQPVVSGPVEKMSNNGVKGIRIELSDNMGAVTFKCGKSSLEFFNEDNPFDIGEVFNPELVKTLTTQFCTKNSSGIMVPKAAFAMNNQSTDTTTGIA